MFNFDNWDAKTSFMLGFSKLSAFQHGKFSIATISAFYTALPDVLI